MMSALGSSRTFHFRSSAHDPGQGASAATPLQHPPAGDEMEGPADSCGNLPAFCGGQLLCSCNFSHVQVAPAVGWSRRNLLVSTGLNGGGTTTRGNQHRNSKGGKSNRNIAISNRSNVHTGRVSFAIKEQLRRKKTRSGWTFGTYHVMVAPISRLHHWVPLVHRCKRVKIHTSATPDRPLT